MMELRQISGVILFVLMADCLPFEDSNLMSLYKKVLAGCISGSEALIRKFRKLHHVLGGALNPTLHLRVQQRNSTALRMAEVLEAHPKMKRVHYPGLPSHPEHKVAIQQMTGFEGVSFKIDGYLNTTKKFIDALKIPYIAPSFKGCESILDQPGIMSCFFYIYFIRT